MRPRPLGQNTILSPDNFWAWWKHLAIWLPTETVSSVYSIMAIQKRTVRSCAATIKWKFRIVSLAQYSTGIGFNMNRVLWIRNFQTSFFLPSITDRIEDINRYMNSVNLILLILILVNLAKTLTHRSLVSKMRTGKEQESPCWGC